MKRNRNKREIEKKTTSENLAYFELYKKKNIHTHSHNIFIFIYNIPTIYCVCLSVCAHTHWLSTHTCAYTVYPRIENTEKEEDAVGLPQELVRTETMC